VVRWADGVFVSTYVRYTALQRSCLSRQKNHAYNNHGNQEPHYRRSLYCSKMTRLLAK